MLTRLEDPSRRFRLLLAVVALLALAARLLPGPRTIDDSFITFRYARNILAGNGFVYNPGEPVLGTTTPLYTFLLTGLALVAGQEQAPFPLLALGVNALADAITCWLLLRLGRRFGVPWAGLGAALVWAVAPFSVTFAIGGLETSLYVLLLTATVWAYIDHHPRLAALLAALAFLTRPDALILLGPLAFERARQVLVEESMSSKRLLELARRLAGELLIFAIPAGAWLLFATLHFGSPLPHSIAAKSVAYHLPAEAAFVRLLQHYATPFQEQLVFGRYWVVAGLVLYSFLFIIGAWHVLRVERRAWPWLAYPWLYFAVFALANPLIFRWYLTPPMPAYILVILAGAERLWVAAWSHRRTVDQDQKAGSPRSVLFPLGRAVMLGLPLVLSLGDWQLHPQHGLPRPAPGMAWYQLELLYRKAADRLAPAMQSAQNTPVLAAGDVGVLGFFTPARILDTVGLNSPVSTAYYPLGPNLYVINYAIPPDLIIDQAPDFLVILEVYGRAGLLKDPRFLDSYRLLEKIPTDIYGSDGMLIFTRHTLAQEASGP